MAVGVVDEDANADISVEGAIYPSRSVLLFSGG
jgi:hypothetical protein